MLSFPNSLKVYLAMDAADLRKSFTGLHHSMPDISSGNTVPIH
jgi:hypothetical protein